MIRQQGLDPEEPGGADGRSAHLRLRLEQSKAAFQQLLGSLSDKDLRINRGSGWSVGEVATHVVGSMEDAPALISALRRENNRLNLPPRVSEPLKRVFTWSTARGATVEGLSGRFDFACRRVMDLIDTIAPGEWERGGHAYGEGYWTVEHAFLCRAEHIEEHIRQIKTLVG